MTQNPISFNPNEMQEFLQDLVMFITGYEIQELEEGKRLEIVNTIREMYMDFLRNWIEEKKGNRKAMQFKIFLKQPSQDLVNKFQELEQDLAQAHEAFIQNAKEMLTEESINQNQ